MKLAFFYTDSITAAWSLTLGLSDTLKRMGHEVTDCPINPHSKSLSRSQFPALGGYDAVLVSGPEYIGKHFVALYPKRSIPVLAWMHESCRREDYGLLNVDDVKRTADHIFCPAEEDTEFGFEFLPFGVDTSVFHPRGNGRDIDLAFIGMMYQKRQEFVSKMPADIRAKLKIGNCSVQDLGGVNIRKSAELYADTLRRIKTFFLLPALSRLVVTKVYEVEACGCRLAKPSSPDDSRRAIEEATCGMGDDSLENRVHKILAKVPVAA